IFVVRAGVEAGACGGIRPEVADQTEKRERALLILLDADAVAIEAAEVETSEVVAAAAGAAVAAALVEAPSGFEIGAAAHAVLQDPAEVRAGQRLAGVARLLVCIRAFGGVAKLEAEAIAALALPAVP